MERLTRLEDTDRGAEGGEEEKADIMALECVSSTRAGTASAMGGIASARARVVLARRPWTSTLESYPCRLPPHTLSASKLQALATSHEAAPMASRETRLRVLSLYKELHRLGRDYPDPAYVHYRGLTRALSLTLGIHMISPCRYNFHRKLRGLFESASPSSRAVRKTE